LQLSTTMLSGNR